MYKVKDKRLHERRLRALPEGVVALRALRCGIAHDVSYQLQYVLVVPEVGEGVVAVGSLCVDEVEDAQFISLLLQQMPRVPQDFTLRVEYDEGRIALHDVGLGVETGFAAAAAAYNHHVEVSSVLTPIEADSDVLRKKDIGRFVSVRIFTGQLLGVAPFGAAVFLTLAVVAFQGIIDADTQRIYQQEYKDGSGRFGAPCYG